MTTAPFTVRSPEIIDGPRTAGSAPTAAASFKAPLLPVVPPGTRIFRARGLRYRLNLGKRPDRFDNATGTKIPGFEFVAAFEEGELRLPAYYAAHGIPEDEQQEFERRLDSSPRKGIDFFDVMALAEQSKEARAAELRAELQSNPELRARLAADLSVEQGFSLPEPAEEEQPEPQEPPKKSARKRRVA